MEELSKATQTKSRGTFTRSRLLGLIALIVAGESIFFLPFVIARVFRPTLLEVFSLTNSELGAVFSIYGVVAMISYVFGGPLADVYSPRKLISTALVATVLGGIVFWSIPTIDTLKWLYAYWGFTTIALFWAALIKATREWGGELSQGTAFGLLDGGRGLLTALMGTIAVAYYSSLMPESIESNTLAMRTSALQNVIVVFAAMSVFAAIFVWFVIPKHPKAKATSDLTQDQESRLSLEGFFRVAKMPIVWVHGFIIICAYVGFKATDDFSHYANEVLQMDQIEAAKVGTYSLWIRPLAAIGAGFLADRFNATKMILISFLILIVGNGLLGFEVMPVSQPMLYVGTIIGTSLGIFALRGLYFAIMEEGKIPLAYTGSAVGLISVVGYTPDIFMPLIIGYFLDRSPGADGHRDVFIVITAFAIAGFFATLLFMRLAAKKAAKED